MKIGIITFHKALNCGAVLQAYALQTYLRSAGYDAEIVNYGSVGWGGKYRVSFGSLRKFCSSIYTDARRFALTFLLEDYRRMCYRRFLRDVARLGPPVTDSRELSKSDYTHFICGSDQIWHPAINRGDSTYFLSFARADQKKVAYAPSFGLDHFTEAQEREMAMMLRSFSSISVREAAGAEIVERLTGSRPQVVCDPTMLLSLASYEQLGHRPVGIRSPFVFVYTVGSHPWAVKYAKHIASRKGLRVVHLIGGYFAQWGLGKGVKRIVTAGPAEFLWLVQHAECVITNSFHGTVFSVLFKRPFHVALNKNSADSRMITLCGSLGCRSSVSSEAPTGDLVLCNWETISRNMDRIRAESIRYLAGALAKGEEVKNG